jgi:type I restriction enzyme S subunit
MSDFAATIEMPEGWVAASLGDIVVPSKAKVEPAVRVDAPYLSLEHIEANTGAIVGCGTALDVISTKAVFSQGDVLYGKLRPYLNKVCIPDFDGICSTDILVFPETPYLKSRYLMRFLMQQRVVEHAHHHSSGVQLPRVAFSKLAEIDFPLPPLAEQRRIVAKVEELLGRMNAARERLAKVPALVKRFRQSVLAAACSGQLTEDWREVNASVPKPDPAGISGPFDLPATWRWIRLDSIVTSIRSGSTAVPKLETTEFPILRSSSVRPCEVDLYEVRYVERSESANEQNFLADGDLLFTRLSGSVEYVANCAIVRNLKGRRIQYPDRLFRVKLNDRKYARYVEYLFGAPFVRKTIMDAAKSSAGHQRVSQGAITNQLVSLPPRAEQQEIVRRVDALFALADKIEVRVKSATARVEKITQAILAKAFRGELVPTEAELAREEGRDYEPASALLDRIRAERGGASNGTPRRKRKESKQPSILCAGHGKEPR